MLPLLFRIQRLLVTCPSTTKLRQLAALKLRFLMKLRRLPFPRCAHKEYPAISFKPLLYRKDLYPNLFRRFAWRQEGPMPAFLSLGNPVGYQTSFNPS